MPNDPLIFGKHTLADANAKTPKSINPMINEHGSGPAATLCSGCKYIIRQTAIGPKCRMRPLRVKHSPFWPACTFFEKAPAE